MNSNRLKLKIITLAIFIISILIYAEIDFIEQEIGNDNYNGTCGVFACDIDNDDDLDVLSASGNQIILWESNFSSSNQGPIIWTKKIIANNITSAHSVYAVDFDNDGDKDIIGAQYGGTGGGVIYWHNNLIEDDSLYFSKQIVSNTFKAHEIYAHDVDSDGDNDILGASSDPGKISWWRNDGGIPIIWHEQNIYTGTYNNGNNQVKSVHVGDFNCDGNSDVVAAVLYENDILWWDNKGEDINGEIIWEKHFVENNFAYAHSVQAIDLDNDGDDDILGAAWNNTTEDQISWWRNDSLASDSSVIWSDKLPIGNNFNNACKAFGIDLDNDGNKDVAATAQEDNTIAWWRHEKIGEDSITWEKSIITDNFTRPWPLYACDLDNDGDNDLISASSYDGNSKIAWFENTLISNIECNYEQQITNYELMQNYPNPFNPKTRINYELRIRNYKKIEIVVFNSQGQEVLSLSITDHRSLITGSIQFDGSRFNSGIYFYSLIIDGVKLESKSMILIK